MTFRQEKFRVIFTVSCLIFYFCEGGRIRTYVYNSATLDRLEGGRGYAPILRTTVLPFELIPHKGINQTLKNPNLW